MGMDGIVTNHQGTIFLYDYLLSVEKYEHSSLQDSLIVALFYCNKWINIVHA